MMAADTTDEEPFDEAELEDEFGTPPVPSWVQSRSRQAPYNGGDTSDRCHDPTIDPSINVSQTT